MRLFDALSHNDALMKLMPCSESKLIYFLSNKNLEEYEN